MVRLRHTVDPVIFKTLYFHLSHKILYYEAIHVFYFHCRGGISIRQYCMYNYGSFLFSLPFTYRENSEIKVTVKLTGSTVVLISRG